ncbi:GMC family oxidoreductase N-terminal domain-containing protein, partial [Anaerococcus tetradius]
NRGRRWSSAKAFLESALDRPNLEVITDARVTRVVMDGRRAIGVSYRRNNKYKQARLNPAGEVLLSGGAVNSPQILMLSGV